MTAADRLANWFLGNPWAELLAAGLFIALSVAGWRWFLKRADR